LLARFKQQVRDRTVEALVKEQEEHDANDQHHSVESNDPWIKEKPPSNLEEIYEVCNHSHPTPP
jgi:hypothetical protein